jgi:hypothetical protein
MRIVRGPTSMFKSKMNSEPPLDWGAYGSLDLKPTSEQTALRLLNKSPEK